jgi:hypothetical protein
LINIKLFRAEYKKHYKPASRRPGPVAVLLGVAGPVTSLNPKGKWQPCGLATGRDQAHILGMPYIIGPKSATSAAKSIWREYRDKTGKILGPELFDGDWLFVANPELRGHEKLTERIKQLADKARAKKSK